MSESPSVTLNFGSVYDRVALDYNTPMLQNFPPGLAKEVEKYKDTLSAFTAEELLFLRWRMMWKAKARQKQLPPKEFETFEKTIWMCRSGRGWGKTLVGSNWLGMEAASFPSQYYVVAPTKDDVRYVCFEGPTGLYSVLPPKLIVGSNLALPSITLWNGSVIRGFAGDTPERLRGPQAAAGWLDEIASWLYPQEAWDNIMFGLRLGPHPRLLVTGTPKPSPFIRELVANKDVANVVGSTYENKKNLPKMFFMSVAKYEGTKVGRQELHGEVLDPEEEGFVRRSDWRIWPSDKPLPRFKYIILSLDTAFTEKTFDKKKQARDPTACTVWGLFERTVRKPNGRKKIENHILLIDAWEDMLSFPQLIKRVKKERRKRYGAGAQELKLRPKIIPVGQRPTPSGKKIDTILIEEKGSGISLRQSLAVEQIRTEGYNPRRADKLERLHYISPLWAHSRVWAVESDKREGEFRQWAEPVITQCCTYTGPGSLKHDDLLDTTTQALRYLMDQYIGSLTIEEDEEEALEREAREASEETRVERNPYDA
jgi:phage terminase large subunit-like protein